ncbi:sporulation YhaL family protein [Desertibacillus haloalkaliphilus]|nr:sporulation YhaL family protein [Desertibacillus haloalkaliphilus]
MAAFFQTTPIWVYAVIIGIIASGYLSFKFSLEEKRVEQKWIEQEGEVYMKRIEAERARRKQLPE